MSADNAIVRERQLAIRRELDRRQVPLQVVSFDSGIPYPTLLTYFPGGDRVPAELPTSAAFALCRALPLDLVNLLCPEGFAVVRIPNDVDYDAINQHCMDFLSEKAAAHHPESEAGVHLGPTEQQRLNAKVVAFPGRAA